jgi:hypothetical protein
MGAMGFIDYLIRVIDRVLYRFGSKNIKFATLESWVHGRAVTDVNYGKISRFIGDIFLLRYTFLVVVALFHLRDPLPRNLSIIFYV